MKITLSVRTVCQMKNWKKMFLFPKVQKVIYHLTLLESLLSIVSILFNLTCMMKTKDQGNDLSSNDQNSSNDKLSKNNSTSKDNL
jgi:hypothetical protein